MSKIGPLLALGVAAPCAVAAGIYLVRSSSFNVNLPLNLESFKKEDGGDCVQALFPGIKSMDKTDATSVDSTTNKVDKEKLFNSETDKASGCLVLNWDKKTKESKWKGNFRFLWAMKKGTKGFITFTKGEVPSDTESKVKWEGIAYTLEEEETNWSIKKKLTIENDKSMDSAAVKTKFPTKGDSISDVGDNAFGFINPTSDSDNMCGQSDCNEGTADSSFKGMWKWMPQDSGDKTADKWSNNLSTEWWNELYTKDKWDMVDLVSGEKGSWEKLLIESKSAPAAASR